MDDVEDILGSAGPLARHLAGFTPRASQQRMASAVAASLRRRSSLVVEAGTGTGKTFAYLVPALLAGARVIVSTGTRTLQDQLFSKDVPLVAGALGLPARIALLKGRSNYLCNHRLERALAQRELDGVGRRDALLGRVEKWSKLSGSGDLAELPGITEAHPLWPAITSTRDNCLGQRCSAYAGCHVVAARRRAQEADLVIVNHHLLLADLALKEDGFGDLLGSADAVILDEAHQLPDLATQFFGTSIGSRRTESLLAEARAAVLATGVPLAAIASQLHDVEQGISALLGVLPRGAGRMRWDDTQADLESFVLGVAASLRELVAALQGLGSDAALGAVAARAGEFAEGFERIATCGDDEGARTVESTGRAFTLGIVPFDIAARFSTMVAARPTAWIFTSATLCVGTDFTHFLTRLGLDCETLHIPSPFDYESQALLYLPAPMPDPSTPAHVEAVVAACLPLLRASRGGAFLLFTSHRALARAAELLRERWDETGLAADAHPLLVQGEHPRERLLREFREHGSAVLLGTASFWEGVDVQGEALRLVVIEKLPFASPGDPLVKARIEHLNRTGANAFRDYQLPEAVLALKQGFGRLVRSESDRGVIAICDPRLLNRSYGSVFRASLPPMTATAEVSEASAFLRRIAPPPTAARASASSPGAAAGRARTPRRRPA